ncbi:hypothetical protein ACGFZL_09380 [Streptomyces sp. NPDC048182]|uniref:hypothetical protein n=1 Tax=Streptomyces sp. NPDC048182 TaxID=3365507 RepID=UPI003710F8DC
MSRLTTETDEDAEPALNEGEAAEETAGEATDNPGRRLPSARWRPIAAAALAALLLLAGGAFLYGAHRLHAQPSARNHALTDSEATTKVAGDVGSALARVFSYTPEGLGTTERSARSVLAGRAARQYADLMTRVRADLTRQRVTLSTQAVRTGVIELDGDDARLLVFLDQISRRGKDPATSVAAQLTVTARWEGDQWRITDIQSR